jgi:hypothetical protein
VRADLLDGLVTAESALEDYGVVFTPRTLDVDKAATRQQRRRMRRQAAMFNRRAYLTAVDSLSLFNQARFDGARGRENQAGQCNSTRLSNVTRKSILLINGTCTS